jgi:hypothetical protein
MFDLILGLKIASQNHFLQKIIFRLNQLDLLPFYFAFTPLPPIHPCIIQPLWGLNLHLLGGRERRKGKEITTKPLLFQMISKKLLVIQNPKHILIVFQKMKVLKSQWKNLSPQMRLKKRIKNKSLIF